MFSRHHIRKDNSDGKERIGVSVTQSPVYKLGTYAYKTRINKMMSFKADTKADSTNVQPQTNSWIFKYENKTSSKL